MILGLRRAQDVELDVSVAASVHVAEDGVLARQRHVAGLGAGDGDIVPAGAALETMYTASAF